VKRNFGQPCTRTLLTTWIPVIRVYDPDIAGDHLLLCHPYQSLTCLKPWHWTILDPFPPTIKTNTIMFCYPRICFLASLNWFAPKQHMPLRNCWTILWTLLVLVSFRKSWLTEGRLSSTLLWRLSLDSHRLNILKLQRFLHGQTDLVRWWTSF
jgi:hypothetical protein